MDDPLNKLYTLLYPLTQTKCNRVKHSVSNTNQGQLMEKINNNKYTIAAAFSAAVFIAFAKLITLVNIGNPNNVLIAAVTLNILFSFTYSIVVRDLKWQLGIFTSFVFWVYLSSVSLSLFFNQQPEWWPFIEGLIILTTACLTVLFAQLSKKQFKTFISQRN